MFLFSHNTYWWYSGNSLRNSSYFSIFVCPSCNHGTQPNKYTSVQALYNVGHGQNYNTVDEM